MPATVLSSTSINVGRLRKDVKQRPSPYYYRSKLLLAPDASSLVQPSWSDASMRGLERKRLRDERILDIIAPDPYASHGGAKYYSALSELNLVDPSPLRVKRSKRSLATKDSCSRHSTPAVFENSHQDQLPLPPPPTFADIMRMEPDLSPISAMRRAGDINPDSVPTRSLYNPSHPSRVAVGHEAYEISEQMRNCEAPRRLPSVIQPNHRPRERVVAGPSRGTIEKLKAMSVWVSEYLYDVVVSDAPCYSLKRDSRNSYSAVHTRMQAGERLFRILMAILPSTSAVMLALWYLSRLPISRLETVKSEDVPRQRFRHFIYEGSTSTVEDVIIRSFVAGSMLADKFMSDSSFSAKSWQSISHIPLVILNGMELSALAIFGFSVQISPKEWQNWLDDVWWYHSSVAPHLGASPYTYSAYGIVGRLLDHATAKAHSHHMLEISQSNVVTSQTYGPAGKDTSDLPPPSGWRSHADEVPCEPNRRSRPMPDVDPIYTMLVDTTNQPRNAVTSSALPPSWLTTYS